MKKYFSITGASYALLALGPALLGFGFASIAQAAPSETQSCASQVLGFNFEAASKYSNTVGEKPKARARGLPFRPGDLGVLVECGNGHIVYEKYDNGANQQTASQLHSATKSFWGPAVAAMIQDGLLKSYDEKVSDVLTEWKNTNKKDITIRQVMQLASGLDDDIPDLQGLNPGASNLYEAATNNLTLLRKPGTHFLYGPSNFYVMGAVMDRALKNSKSGYKDPLDYLQKRLLSQVGVTYVKWVRDAAGNPHIPNGCYMTPRNFATWGRFLLQHGNWNGKQIVRKDLMDELYKPSPANPDFGMFLWLNTRNGFGAAPLMAAPSGSAGGFIYHNGYTDMFAALGAGKNRMYIIPSLNVVIVRQTLKEGDAFQDNTFLSDLIGH